MPEIYLISSSEIYSKLFELCLKGYNVNLKIINNETEFDKFFQHADLIVYDDEFSSDPSKFINKCLEANIPIIYLKDVFSEKEPPVEQDDKLVILEKPFEENDLLEKIKKFIDLKKGEPTMAEEKKVTPKSEEEDILELTDIVEEGEPKEEISDIFSAEKKDEKILDDFFEEEEEEVEPVKEPTGAIVEDELEEKSQEVDDSNEILKNEDIENLMDEQEVAEEKDEEKAEETEEEMKIPVDEETKNLANEIENGDKFEEPIIEKKEVELEPEIEKKVTKEKIKIETAPIEKALKLDKKEIDMAQIETKLLEATNKVIEAIEEATVEIAGAIARSTPKIIEEVARQIIPAIAKKIISEEIDKKEEEK